MQRRIAGILAGALFLLPPTGAAAMLMEVDVKFGIHLGFEPPLTMASVTGIATVNASAGGNHLVTLKLNPMDPVDLGTIVFTNMEITASIISLRFLDAEIKGGTFYNLSGAITTPNDLTQDTMLLAGVARVCFFVAGCTAFLDIPFTENGTQGLGLGGTIVTSTVSSERIFSLAHAPWQLAPATLDQQTPISGNVTIVTHTGYAHGPVSASATSSTALTNGVIQLVSPTQLHNTGIGAGSHDTIALFTTITVTFLPEPRLLLLLGWGVMGLALIGRSRIRK